MSEHLYYVFAGPKEKVEALVALAEELGGRFLTIFGDKVIGPSPDNGEYVCYLDCAPPEDKT